MHHLVQDVDFVLIHVHFVIGFHFSFFVSCVGIFAELDNVVDEFVILEQCFQEVRKFLYGHSASLLVGEAQTSLFEGLEFPNIDVIVLDELSDLNKSFECFHIVLLEVFQISDQLLVQNRRRYGCDSLLGRTLNNFLLFFDLFKRPGRSN